MKLKLKQLVEVLNDILISESNYIGRDPGDIKVEMICCFLKNGFEYKAVTPDLENITILTQQEQSKVRVYKIGTLGVIKTGPVKLDTKEAETKVMINLKVKEN